MVEKVTIMVIKTDLQCESCYKKVKKVLCKFPEIRDQVYDEKQNTVTITVLTCCPDWVRDKLCSRGGKSIKSIEYKSFSKPKEPEKKSKEPEKPMQTEKPKEPEKKPKEIEKPKEPIKKPKESEKKDPEKTVKFKEPEKKDKTDTPKDIEKPKSDGKSDKPTENQKPANEVSKAQKQLEVYPGAPITVSGYPTYYPSGGPYGGPVYNGYGYSEGQYNQAYGRPIPCYDNYGYGQYGQFANRGHHVSPHEYFSEENPEACSIM